MKKKKGLSRRKFVAALPAAAVSVSVAGAGVQQGGQQAAPGKITREMLHTAEQLIGLEFTEAQETMALQPVNQNLGSYESLRKLNIPLDTPLATSFHPAYSGRKVQTGAIVRGKVRGTAKVTKPAKLEDLAFNSLSQLSELVRTKQVSSSDLTRMYLARLKKYSPKLLNVITLTEELALKQAAQADEEIKRGKYRGPLHGIPCGVKDLFSTKGIPTTWGAEPYKNQMIDYDSTVVERLRDAGAVLVAKLSMGALAQGGRWFAGVTRNPWQPEEDRIGSSGSSAGSASATSAGLLGFAIGTETLGSIVSPSSRCGVAGLRPTYGRISRYGAMALSWTMDKVGPIARSIEDCALILDALYGSDGKDETVIDAPFNWNPDTKISGMKIGYLKAEFETGNDERKKLYADALEVLRKQGANLQPVELPQFPTTALRIILVAEAATAFDDLTRDGGVNQLSGQAPGDWPNTFRSSRFIPAVEYLRAMRARSILQRQMDDLMRKWDVLVTPAPGSASLTLTNLTGQPQAVVPCGFINKLPQAIMFTGNLYDEVSPLRVALAYERATEWHNMHPKFD